MKQLLLLSVFAIAMLVADAQPQVLKDTLPPGSVELAYYEGRMPCREIMQALNVPYRAECLKRKTALLLYVDATTRKPTFYKLQGMDIRSGKGKWIIEKGIPADPQATVYRLEMGKVSLLLLKGGDQVLFVLDKDKNFLVGNDKFSYTMNRVMDKRSWDNWRSLLQRGLPF
jgi:hypothetical protein